MVPHPPKKLGVADDEEMSELHEQPSITQMSDSDGIVRVNRCFMVLLLVLTAASLAAASLAGAGWAAANKSQSQVEALHAKISKLSNATDKIMEKVREIDHDCIDASEWYRRYTATVPWRKTSQGNQDSVLASLFAHLGTTNKYFVEFGYQGTEGANTWQLHEQGWQGFRLDGGSENIAERWYKHMITPENIVSLFDKYEAPSKPDYVSIDIDSCDLWVFLNLTTTYRPRVMTAEYQIFFPLGVSKTNICRTSDGEQYQWHTDVMQGASLSAYAKAADKRGYAVIYVEKGLDVFLVRKDLLCKGSELPLETFADKTGFNLFGYTVPDDATMNKWIVDY